MIYQFRIELLDVEPKIWRQIQVPSTFNMFDLHGAVNDAMGWLDFHFHVFKVVNRRTNKKEYVGRAFDADCRLNGPIDGRTVSMTNYFVKSGDTADYVYDFGDRWEHTVMLEQILPVVWDKCYPVCTNGKRACPPEDCGGFDGYKELLSIIRNPQNPDYAKRWNWLTHVHDYPNFNPETFCPEYVYFRPSETRQLTANNKAEAACYDFIKM